MGDKEAKNVSTAIKGIGQLSVQVARQPTEKVPTLKFLASQVPQRGTIPEELCINLNEIATALEEFGQLETDRQPTDPIIPLKCLGSQIPRGNISDDDAEDERTLTDQPQNLKFLASQMPQIPQDVTKDFSSEFIENRSFPAVEEQPEARDCLGSQIPKAKAGNDHVEHEGEIAEQPQNLKFLASQIPQIPQEQEDIGNEALSSAEENPEEVKCLGLTTPDRDVEMGPARRIQSHQV